jgi:hypothetical protein
MPQRNWKKVQEKQFKHLTSDYQDDWEDLYKLTHER